MHVTDREQVNQRPDTRDNQRHQARERVQFKTEFEVVAVATDVRQEIPEGLRDAVGLLGRAAHGDEAEDR